MTALAAIGVAGVAAHAQQVNDRHPFAPGDLISLGANSYPPNAIYRIVSCDPVDKVYRECGVIRQAPDPESHVRPLTMANYREITVVGRAAAAPAATAAAPPEPTTAMPKPTAARTAPPAPTASAAPAAGGACPASPYGGPVPGTRAASAALFRQKITDSITMAAYRPFWYGVRLDDFSVGAPVRNVVGTLPGGGASRVNNGAPVNAIMYPVSTTISVCEGAPAGSSAWRTSRKKYLCFVSAGNEWTCGASN